MNLEKIKLILASSTLTKEQQEYAILNVLSEDKKVISYLLQLLEAEREVNKDLILDSNERLSLALVTLNMSAKDDKSKKALKEQKSFVIESIKKHYITWKHRIKCNFNIPGLP